MTVQKHYDPHHFLLCDGEVPFKRAEMNYLTWFVKPDIDSAAPSLEIGKTSKYTNQEESTSYDELAGGDRHC